MSPRKQGLVTASLPRMLYKHRVKGIFQKFQRSLGARCDQAHLANLSLEYVRLGSALVNVPFRDRHTKVQAIDIAQNFRPPLTGRNFEVIGNADFENSAGLLITNEDFALIGEMIAAVRNQAQELKLPWKTAKPIFCDALQQFLPDERRRPEQRGEFLEEIMEELILIRSAHKTWKNFDDFRTSFPDFKVFDIIDSAQFDKDDREYLMTPNQWETKTAAYRNGLLKKYWSVSEETVKSYRKQRNRQRNSTHHRRK